MKIKAKEVGTEISAKSDAGNLEVLNCWVNGTDITNTQTISNEKVKIKIKNFDTYIADVINDFS